MTGLKIGVLANGKQVTLPLDYVVQPAAILAIRGAGKTSTAAVIAEEMCEAHQPWICLDPVGVWWGMRANADGKPGGYPVVVIGGEHGDLPLERDAGVRIAEALMAEPICAVIDLSQESKRFWHTFVTDFALHLMRLNPDVPRHLFIEEAPEFVPQRTRVELTARCKEAVTRLISLGRNHGYGCTLISQRPATVDKDVLSQCETLFVLRTVGPHDRKALKEWIAAQASDKGLEKFLDEVAGLPNGTAWLWSPHWLDTFEKVRIRERRTFHPGATRTIGQVVKAATLSGVEEFVEKLKRQLTKKRVIEAPPTSIVGGGKVEAGSGRVVSVEVDGEKLMGLGREIARLRNENSQLRGKVSDAERRLELVRKATEPQYQALKALHKQLGTDAAVVGDRGTYEPWFRQAKRAGIKRMLDVMIEKGELQRTQLATLAGMSVSGTFGNYLGWLKRNGLVDVDGGTVRLKPLA